MKNQKKDGGGAGLQDWLSYQARTAAVVHPETDVIDWDEGIEVQEEWLPRELCEQRLREGAERVEPSQSLQATAADLTPVIELQNIPLEYFAPTDSKGADTKLADQDIVELEVAGIEVTESDLAETHFAFDSATAHEVTQELPAEVIAVTAEPLQAAPGEITLADILEPRKEQEAPAEVTAVSIDAQLAPQREITLADIIEPKASASAPAPIEAHDIGLTLGCTEPALQT